MFLSFSYWYATLTIMLLLLLEFCQVPTISLWVQLWINISQNCSIFQYSKNVHPYKALFILGNTPKTSVYMVEYFSGIISSVACHCHNCKGYWFDQVLCSCKTCEWKIHKFQILLCLLLPACAKEDPGPPSSGNGSLWTPSSVSQSQRAHPGSQRRGQTPIPACRWSYSPTAAMARRPRRSSASTWAAQSVMLNVARKARRPCKRQTN